MDFIESRKTMCSCFLYCTALPIVSESTNKTISGERSVLNPIEQDCHPRNTSDGSRQGSYNLLIESLLILL